VAIDLRRCGSQPTKAIQATRVLLRSVQRSDLNLLAAYRKMPVLDAPPSTITYTAARTRAVYRKTVEKGLRDARQSRPSKCRTR
jgi:hypothetical protein